ncbi:MAG: DUF3488 and transglutaminase-like domain-containing protein [Mariniblastus sp.]|nr:DUF3488 and transglutaminase-like domain-containing protein [Mariniblastus sp.]
MHPRKQMVEWTCLLLVTVSGFLLGASQNSVMLTMIAFTGALLPLILVDWLRLFYLRGWLANVASILILLYAMKDFYGGNSTTKLISVGQLLIYLQTILLFQKKTPRLYWQVLVLTLLQVVVAAIFNLNLEGGLLFILYFAIAGAMMMLQCESIQRYEVNRLNRENLTQARSRIESLDRGSYTCRGSSPCMVYASRVSTSGARMVGSLLPWLFVGFVFSVVLFYNVPRTDSAWLGPGMKKVTATGLSYRVNLDNRGVISDSGQLVFRAWFTDPQSEDKIQLTQPPYFRGMPLSRWTVEKGVTTWKAPYDSVYEFSYQSLSALPSQRNGWLISDIAMEATTDPLLFGLAPGFRLQGTSQEIEYCRDLSAMSRRRRSDQAEMATYQYRLAALVDRANRPLESWPYTPDMINLDNLTLPQNIGEFKSLVHLEGDRYPALVEEAERISRQAGKSDTLNLCRAMNNFFLPTNQFSYTLDFQDIPRTEGLDPVEDFFKNHRTGHCQLFASALTIMLRSQDIPARLVVGFYGGEYNKLNECYMVRQRNAHAWVEAYIPPEDCTPEMFASGAAGPGGAWLALDPTSNIYTAETSVINGEPLELARNLWQDYVLGMDATKQLDAMELEASPLLGFMDLSNWQSAGQRFADEIRIKSQYQFLLIAVVVGLALLVVFRKFKLKRTLVERKPKVAVSRFRKMVGNALFWISPQLGTWVMGDVYIRKVVPFYEKMTQTLQQDHDLKRQPNQTHREFAQLVGEHFYQHPAHRLIQDHVSQITEAFYQVRFGQRALDNRRIETIERMASELEEQLKMTSPVIGG